MITSTDRDEAVPLRSESLTQGELKTYPSFASPWSLHVFPHQEITKRVAQVDDETMAAVAGKIQAFTEVS